MFSCESSPSISLVFISERLEQARVSLTKIICIQKPQRVCYSLGLSERFCYELHLYRNLQALTLSPVVKVLFIIKKINGRRFVSYLRGSHQRAVPRFNSYFIRNSTSHRGSILSNALTPYYHDKKVKNSGDSTTLILISNSRRI